MTFLLRISLQADATLLANVSLKLGELELHGHVIAAVRLAFLGASARRALNSIR